jgi:hypothetical protein
MGRFKQDDWELTGEHADVDGHDCQILRKKYGKVIERCWVDLERGYSIVRYEFRTTYRFQIDVSYKKVVAHGWVPTNWEVAQYQGSGELEHSAKATVTGYTINKPIPKELYDFEFPIGTEVNDNQNDTTYIVRQEGVRRLITEDERKRGATYEQFLVTESGQAGLPPQSRESHWLAYGALGLVAVALISLGIRRRWLHKAT